MLVLDCTPRIYINWRFDYAAQYSLAHAFPYMHYRMHVCCMVTSLRACMYMQCAAETTFSFFAMVLQTAHIALLTSISVARQLRKDIPIGQLLLFTHHTGFNYFLLGWIGIQGGESVPFPYPCVPIWRLYKRVSHVTLLAYHWGPHAQHLRATVLHDL